MITVDFAPGDASLEGGPTILFCRFAASSEEMEGVQLALARSVFSAVISTTSSRGASSPPTGKHRTNAARFYLSSLKASIAAAVASWRDMDDEVKINWSRPLARDALALRRLLHTMPGLNNEDAPFFRADGGNIDASSLARRLLPVVDRKLRLGVSPAAARMLDAYESSFVESITLSKDLLEDWDRSRRQPLVNCTQTAAVDHDLLDEPPLVALARHLTALGSRVDDLVSMAIALYVLYFI
ncbi:hypothetical protein ColTof4_14431 [Colletotrichum tofieldiae]|nr:hypothetical protein ColTof3_14848 [Colletotrichum tofieldiae]GKT82008.1 hypothetical protein ColTof4_14431 [Colletotrichum tofieldiae]